MSDAKAGLLVPLVFHGRVMGVLEAFDSLGGTLEFSAEDERIMEAFAASAATAVATAQDVAEQTLLRSIDASDRERGALGARAARRDAAGAERPQDHARAARNAQRTPTRSAKASATAVELQ